MKKILTLMIMIIFLAAPNVFAKNVKYTLTWSPNTEPDMAGYKIYIRLNDNPYNYDDPQDPVCTIKDGKCWVDPTNENCDWETPDIPIPDGELTTICFVARAYDTGNNYSEDSNEVCDTVDLRILPASLITASIYNDATKTIDFVFTQEQSDRVIRWELYMGPASGGPYNKIKELVNSEGLTSPYSISWDVPGDGDYYFVIVGFTDEINSVDSNEVYVNVKVHPSPMHNFKIKARIQ